MWEVDESTDLWGDAPSRHAAGGETERFVTGELTSDDLDVERGLRPQRLEDYCGQEHIKQSRASSSRPRRAEGRASIM